ncbi:30S ribosomal protein S15 [Candidatus Woesearchaeota archaeon]|nr:30S ribosomal protein S15 [Candidatus Woesearchaeota archaeon]
MARMHSRTKGKSGSKKPAEMKKPFWLNKKPKEIELVIAKLAKEGNTASKIGIILRDSYGIPDAKVLLGKTIGQVLKEKKLEKELPEDLLALIKRTVALRAHLEENKQDRVAKRGLQITDSKIKRLTKYYKSTGKIDEKWKFDPERAKMFVE